MKDILLDIVNCTYGLGFVELVKIVGTATETNLFAMAEDKSVVMNAEFHAPISEFVGTFGLPNMGVLNTILNIPEYKENSTVTVLKKTDGTPERIHFENSSSDFNNEYRLMNTEQANAKISTVKFKGATWSVIINPEIQNIQRLKYQSQANSEEKAYVVKTDGGKLKFYFGEPSTHTGEFVFHEPVTGKLTKGCSWPIAHTISILNLTGDKTMSFSDDGALLIEVDTGIAKYSYILPAMTK